MKRALLHYNCAAFQKNPRFYFDSDHQQEENRIAQWRRIIFGARDESGHQQVFRSQVHQLLILKSGHCARGHSACISFPVHTPALCGRVTTIQPELPLPTEIRHTQQAERRDHTTLNSKHRCSLTQTHESRQHRAKVLLGAGGEEKKKRQR